MDIIKNYSRLLIVLILCSIAVICSHKYWLEIKPFTFSFISKSETPIEYQLTYTKDSSENLNAYPPIRQRSISGIQNIVMLIHEKHISKLQLKFLGKNKEFFITELNIKGKKKHSISKLQQITSNTDVKEISEVKGSFLIKPAGNNPAITLTENFSAFRAERHIIFLPLFLIFSFSIIISYNLVTLLTNTIQVKGTIIGLQQLITILFLFLLIIPFWGTLVRKGFQNEKILHTENRRVTQYVPFNFNSIKKYFKNTEMFITDRLLDKDEISDLVNSYFFQPALFTKIDLEKGVIGENGFLFIGNSFDNVINRHFNISNYQSNNLKELNEIHGTISEFAKKVGADYFILVAPDKHTIYPEYFPTWAKRSDQSEVIKISMEKKEILEKYGVHICYPVENLIKSKKDTNLLYYKTDTHWNTLGAECAFYTLMNVIQQKGSSFLKKPFQRSKGYSLCKLPCTDDMGVRSILGLPKDFKIDDIKYVFSLSQPIEVDFKENDNNSKKILFQNATATGCIGTWQAVMKNSSAPNKLSVLIICDSFMYALSPFFNLHFSEVYYFSRNDPVGKLENLEQQIRKIKPNIIIYETVERCF